MNIQHRRSTWLVQWYVEEAVELALEFEQRPHGLHYPAISRHTDDVQVGDRVLFWVLGARSTKAGVYGMGVVTGPVEDRLHPLTYEDPDGPRGMRPSLPVRAQAVAEHVVVNRAQLKPRPEFDDFELFVRPNRPNLFAVSDAHWSLLEPLLAARGLSAVGGAA